MTTAAAIEAYSRIAGNTHRRLSPQQLVDCTYGSPWGNYGCEGGSAYNALAYASQTPLERDDFYSYLKKSYRND